MAETKIDRKERRQLNLTWVGEPQPLREGSKVQILHFNADNGINYQTFNQGLFDYIKQHEKEAIDADTELQVTMVDGAPKYQHWRVTQVYEDNKPIAEAKKPEGYAPRTYGKSSEQLAQERQLAEAQNRSIQAQTALNRAVDLAIADNIERQGSLDLKPIMLVAREFYALLQSLAQISEAEVIDHEIKRHKDAKESQGTLVTEAGQEARKVAVPTADKPTDSPSRESDLFTTGEEIRQWGLSHGKGPTELKAALGLGTLARVTDIPNAVKILREKFGWED